MTACSSTELPTWDAHEAYVSPLMRHLRDRLPEHTKAALPGRGRAEMRWLWVLVVVAACSGSSSDAAERFVTAHNAFAAVVSSAEAGEDSGAYFGRLADAADTYAAALRAIDFPADADVDVLIGAVVVAQQRAVSGASMDAEARDAYTPVIAEALQDVADEAALMRDALGLPAP